MKQEENNFFIGYIRRCKVFSYGCQGTKKKLLRERESQTVREIITDVKTVRERARPLDTSLTLRISWSGSNKQRVNSQLENFVFFAR